MVLKALFDNLLIVKTKVPFSQEGVPFDSTSLFETETPSRQWLQLACCKGNYKVLQGLRPGPLSTEYSVSALLKTSYGLQILSNKNTR